MVRVKWPSCELIRPCIEQAKANGDNRVGKTIARLLLRIHLAASSADCVGMWPGERFAGRIIPSRAVIVFFGIQRYLASGSRRVFLRQARFDNARWMFALTATRGTQLFLTTRSSAGRGREIGACISARGALLPGRKKVGPACSCQGKHPSGRCRTALA